MPSHEPICPVVFALYLWSHLYVRRVLVWGGGALGAFLRLAAGRHGPPLLSRPRAPRRTPQRTGMNAFDNITTSGSNGSDLAAWSRPVEGVPRNMQRRLGGDLPRLAAEL